MGLDNMEGFKHGGDPAKMAGPRTTTENVLQSGDLNKRSRYRWIHFLGRAVAKITSVPTAARSSRSACRFRG